MRRRVYPPWATAFARGDGFASRRRAHSPPEGKQPKGFVERIEVAKPPRRNRPRSLEAPAYQAGITLHDPVPGPSSSRASGTYQKVHRKQYYFRYISPWRPSCSRWSGEPGPRASIATIPHTRRRRRTVSGQRRGVVLPCFAWPRDPGNVDVAQPTVVAGHPRQRRRRRDGHRHDLPDRLPQSSGRGAHGLALGGGPGPAHRRRLRHPRRTDPRGRRKTRRCALSRKDASRVSPITRS